MWDICLCYRGLSHHRGLPGSGEVRICNWGVDTVCFWIKRCLGRPCLKSTSGTQNHCSCGIFILWLWESSIETAQPMARKMVSGLSHQYANQSTLPSIAVWCQGLHTKSALPLLSVSACGVRESKTCLWWVTVYFCLIQVCITLDKSVWAGKKLLWGKSK